MPSKNPAQRLADIIDNVDAIQGFIADLDFPAFRADRKTVYAVVRALEIISEASRRLSAEMKARHPDIPWRKVSGSGNIYRHDYEDVVHRLVWGTVHEFLPALRAVAETELAAVG